MLQNPEENPGGRRCACWGPGEGPREAGRLSLEPGLETEGGSQEQERLQLLCYILMFFFLLLFLKM